MPPASPRALFIANKDLSLNSRVLRQTRTLVENGYEVAVIAPELPGHLDARAGVMTLRLHVSHPLIEALKRVLRRLTSSNAPVPGLTSGAERSTHRLNLAARRLLAHSRESFVVAGRRLYAATYPIYHARRFARTALTAGRELPVDVIIAHDSLALPCALALGREKQIPVLYDAVEIPRDRRGWILHGMPAWVARAATANTRHRVRQADRISTIGTRLAALIEREYDVPRPTVIRNCQLYQTPDPELSPIRSDTKLQGDQSLVLYLNSVSPGQGLKALLQAMTHLPEHVHVATLGPILLEPYRDELLALARKLDVHNRFHILPTVSGDRVIAYASGADIGIIPRRASHANAVISLPNRVFELVMARLPIAACSLPEIAEFVGAHGIGEIFDETDPEDIAKVVRRLLAPERLNLLRSRLDRKASSLSWESESRVWIRLVDQLSKRPTPPAEST